MLLDVDRGAVTLLVLISAWAAAPRAARAETTRNPAVAQALFEEAQKLVKAGDYEQACPKFKQSYDADPGGGTLLNLAACYEKQGKTALAWSTFVEARDVAQRDGRAERVAFADEHIHALAPTLSRLTIVVPEESRIPGLTVALDGTPFGQAGWGTAMPVDPGKHTLRAEAPGKAPFEATVDVPSGGPSKHEVSIPPLPDATSEKPGGEPAAAEPSAGSGARTAGFVVGGFGLVALGVGGYFGLRAFSRWDERNEKCEAGCTQAAKDAGDDAQQAATISTIGFAVGLTAVAVGSYLVISAGGSEREPPKSAQVIPLLGPRQAGVSLRGAW